MKFPRVFLLVVGFLVSSAAFAESYGFLMMGRSASGLEPMTRVQCQYLIAAEKVNASDPNWPKEWTPSRCIALLDNGTPALPPNCPSGSAASGEYCGIPDVDPRPIIPPPLPFLANLVAGAVALAAAMLAGIAVGVGAPVIVPSLAASLAFSAAVAALSGLGGSAGPERSLQEANSPVSVNLQNSPTPTGPPLSGDTSPPSVQVSPDGRFVPGGGGLFTGNGATGGWNTGGASGDWTYTPAPTTSNPSPVPIASILNSNNSVSLLLPSQSGGPSSSVLTIAKHPDGTVIVIKSGTVPVTTASGVPTTVDVHVITPNYPFPIPLDNPGPYGGVVAVSPTLGNGSPSLGSGATPIGAGSGAGLGSGAGSGSPTGGGGCGSVDCALESTQLQNKALLTSIDNFLKTPGSAPDDPLAKTGANIKGAGLTKDAGGVLGGLVGWRLPAHTAQCPTSSFEWGGRSFTFDAHCQLVANHFDTLRQVMTVVFALSALFIVLKA